MKEEIKMSNLTRNTITSMEVAEMVGKEHSKLGTGKYHAELIERGYEIERCVCSRCPV